MSINRLSTGSDATWNRCWVIDTTAEVVAFMTTYTAPLGPRRGDMILNNEAGQLFIVTNGNSLTQLTGIAVLPIDLTTDVTGRLPYANFPQGTALSVLGVTGNALADQASIAAGTDHQVLRRSGTALAFGAVNLAQAAAVTGKLGFTNLAQGNALSVLGVTGNAVGDQAPIVANNDNQVIRRSGTAVAFGAINLASSDAVTGILADGNLSSNIPLKNGTNAFSGANSFATNPLSLLVGQILFPSTQNPSSNANTLDDYEEGTFNPIIGGSGGQTGQVYSKQYGAYLKVGGYVTVWVDVILSTLGTITTSVQIANLPFASLNDANYRATGTVMWSGMNNNYLIMQGLIAGNTTVALINALGAAGTGLLGQFLVQANLTATTRFVFTMTYRTDS